MSQESEWDAYESNWISISIMHADLSVALSSTETDTASRLTESQLQAERNALAVYREVKDISARTPMPEATRSELNRQLEELRTRLVARGLDV